MIVVDNVKWSAKRANGQESGEQVAEVRIIDVTPECSNEDLLAEAVEVFGSVKALFDLANRQHKTDTRNRAAEAYRREGDPKVGALVNAIKAKAKTGDIDIDALMLALGLK
jgi:hypothetical protein